MAEPLAQNLSQALDKFAAAASDFAVFMSTSNRRAWTSVSIRKGPPLSSVRQVFHS